VERHEVKTVAECSLRPGTQVEQSEVPDVVGRILPRPGSVSVDVRLRELSRASRGFLVGGRGVIVTPLQHVDSRVDDQASGPHQLELKSAEITVGIPLVPAGLPGQPLGVEPQFRSGVDTSDLLRTS
jgi:hypothetical protein